MPKVPDAYRRVLEEHRRRLISVVDKRGVKRLRRLYEKTLTDLERKLAAIPGGKRDAFTAHQYRLFIGQLRQALSMFSQKMVGGLQDITRDAQVEALRGLIDDVARLEKEFTGAEVVLPVEEAGRFQGVISGRRESMLRASEVSSANYSAQLIRSMEDQLSLSLLAQEDLGEAIDRVVRTGEMEWWKAERIARTETAFAFNASHLDGMVDASSALPDLMMRWTEHVDDDSYKPRDDRVSLDSVAMHGQVARPGEPFFFPTSLPRGAPRVIVRHGKTETWNEVAGRFVGAAWMQPPNRPNDRSVLAPWRPGWGIPAWRVEGGRRVRM